MKIGRFTGNSMTIKSILDKIVPDETLKSVYCLECGSVFKIDIDSWEETEGFVCDKCNLELINNIKT